MLYHPGADDVVFISFAEFDTCIDGTKFWGDSLFASRNATAIGVMPARPNWFPPSKMAVANATIRAQLKKFPGAKRVLYGHSQGGYGALRYGAELRADVAIAFCPQYSIAAADIGAFDQRYLEYAPDEPMRVLPEHLARRNYVMADPFHKVDMIHARTIGEMGPVEFVPLPFTGHESIRLVSEASIAWPFINTIVEGEGSLEIPLRQMVRANRRRSPTYLAHLASALRNNRRPGLAIPLFREVRQMRQDRNSDLIGLIQCHCDLKQYAQASELVAEIELSLELDVGMLQRLAWIFGKIGDAANVTVTEDLLKSKRSNSLGMEK